MHQPGSADATARGAQCCRASTAIAAAKDRPLGYEEAFFLAVVVLSPGVAFDRPAG